jgi:hypothetical protein
MLHAITAELKLDNLADYGNVHTSDIEHACSQIEVERLEQIIRTYTADEDMFTQKYLFGRNENIKLLVDIGKAVESPEATAAMYKQLENKETLFVRCIVEVFKAYHDRTVLSDRDKVHPTPD